MNKRVFSLLCLFLFLSTLFVSIPSIRADDDDDGSDDVDVDVRDAEASEGGASATTDSESSESVEADIADGALKSSDDIATRFYFPQSFDRSFVVGEEILLLVGVSNSGQQSYNLSYLYANLRSPVDFNYLIQNYTALPINTVLEGGKEISLAYRFRPDEHLEPLEFRVESFLDYSLVSDSGSIDADSIFRSAVFNASITLLEKKSEFNAQTFFQYVLFAAIGGIIVYTLAGPSGVTGGKKKKSKAAIANANAEKNNVEWTVEEYKPAAQSKAVKRTRSSKK